MATYQYQSIQSSRSIRILKLEPSDRTSALRCNLIEASLDDAPKYDALSYTWGSQDLSRHIYCDGKILSITENCREILRHLRSKTQSQMLWIDAICINQESIAERGQQVQIMGDIYKTAQRVLIWLGKGTKDSSLAFEYLSQFAIQASTSQEEFERFLAGKLREIGFDRKLKLIKVVKHALDRPWFTRMWTLQELALGTEVLVLCGKASITWHYLALGVQTVREALHHETSIAMTEDDLSGAILNHNMLRWTVQQKTKGQYGWQSLAKPLSFLNLLICSYGKGVTNPKDKVFALYGVCQALEMALPKPDYSKSVEEIYREATQAAILHDKSLNILDLVVLCGVAPGAPSWVPNWNGVSYATMAHVPFHAARDSSPYYHFSSDGSQLTLSGIRVDYITTRGDPVFYPGGLKATLHNSLNELETFKSAREWYQYVRHLNPYRTGQSAKEAFFRTLIMDGAQTKNNARDIERFRDSFQQWFPLAMNCKLNSDEVASKPSTANSLSSGKVSTSNPTLLSPNEALDQNNAAGFFQTHVMILLSGKAFFVTEAGYMGTSLETTRVGDILAVFAGMDLPAVVRKEGDSYRYIGPAYAHGIMDGEAWEKRAALAEKFTII